MRVGAVQLEVALGDIERNTAECERLARAAAREGARLVSLPEFFTTGAAFLPELAVASLPPDGPATAMLSRVADEEGIWLGGSFLCRDADGEVRNAYFLAGPGGEILGRHDKDLPTMWENALYIGGAEGGHVPGDARAHMSPGDDDGVIGAGPFTAGAAVCWEFMRSATARRLRGRVDVVVGGSNWWSVPSWPPRRLTARMERANAATARRAPVSFTRMVGAPVVHAAISGEFRCRMPEAPVIPYAGRFEGGALVVAADGTVLAERRRDEGSGVVIADVEIGRTQPAEDVPDSYWLHRRGLLPTIAWHTQRWQGRRWYRRHVHPHP